MDMAVKNPVPLAAVLGQLSEEMASLRGQLLAVENVLDFARIGPEHVAEIQAIDHISQTLGCLEEFMNNLARALPPGLEADPAAASRGLGLKALADRLGHAAETPQAQPEIGELHLF